jgi:Thioredoxin
MCTGLRLSALLLSLSVLALVCLAEVAVEDAPDAGSRSSPPAYVDLTVESIDAAAAASPLLLMLYASYSGGCTAAMPMYAEVTMELKAEDVTVARANIWARERDDHNVLMWRFGFHEYPSFYLVAGGRTFKYTGEKTKDGIVAFARGEKAHAKEITGLANPIGFYWVSLVKWLTRLDPARTDRLIRARYSPNTVACGLAILILMVLATIAYTFLRSIRPAAIREKKKE